MYALYYQTDRVDKIFFSCALLLQPIIYFLISLVGFFVKTLTFSET